MQARHSSTSQSTGSSTGGLGEAINLNLGTIGRLESHYVRHVFGRSAHWDYSIALAEAHTGLPRPAHELDCRVLAAPAGTPLVVLGARHHDVGYYVIANLAERGCRGALKRVLKTRRLELGLTTSGVNPCWSSLHFEDEPAGQLHALLYANLQPHDDSWRDCLGALLLQLPALMKAAAPQAPACTKHAAVLVSGDYGLHAARRNHLLREL